MRVFITGVTGFIGNALSKKLVEKGYDVFGLVRFTSTSSKIPNGVKIVTGDLIDYYSISTAIRLIKPEVVVHLAGLTPVSLSFSQPEAYFETNLLGTVRLLECLKRYNRENLKLFIFAGTTEMYDTIDPINTITPFNPKSPYAISKVASVYYCKYMYKIFKLPIVVAVLCNTYGRANVGQKHFVIEKIITSMLEGKEKILMGNPLSRRDFMFREDHVNAYISIIENIINKEKRELIGNSFIFGTGKAYSIHEVFSICSEITGWSGEVKWNAFIRPYDQPVIITNPERARKELGWTTKYDIREGLKRATEEWREKLGL